MGAAESAGVPTHVKRLRCVVRVETETTGLMFAWNKPRRIRFKAHVHVQKPITVQGRSTIRDAVKPSYMDGGGKERR